MVNSEEQDNEVEALKSIFADDIYVLHDDNDRLKLHVKIQNNTDLSTSRSKCILQFILPKLYPDEIPIMDILSNHISDFQKEKMKNVLISEAGDNLGMPMIFTLISFIQDWWYIDSKEIKKKMDEEILRKETEKYKRIDGIAVTIDSFIHWKSKFDEERLRKMVKTIDEDQENRPTGRQLFERNSMLMLSDEMLLTADSENLEDLQDLEIDESLFEDIDEEIANLNL
ncbi:RWD domain-containing protein 1-like isoform X1 [Gordionus sp. m RMFG-2023]|uniref:RWD domain-containing protein 1-like isoform X1 n=1 Tax=Gordionus sp. m RMFG-2023 TaxID=3053472 RepID=UPI0031FCB75D